MNTFQINLDSLKVKIIQKENTWSKNSSRILVVSPPNTPKTLAKSLSKFHNREITEIKFVKRINLKDKSTK